METGFPEVALSALTFFAIVVLYPFAFRAVADWLSAPLLLAMSEHNANTFFQQVFYTYGIVFEKYFLVVESAPCSESMNVSSRYARDA